MLDYDGRHRDINQTLYNKTPMEKTVAQTTRTELKLDETTRHKGRRVGDYEREIIHKIYNAKVLGV